MVLREFCQFGVDGFESEAKNKKDHTRAPDF